MKKDYEVVIIGAGVVGAGSLRELSLHNVRALLLDQADFSSQTSQGSSKMLHGGIRYLENLDFALVFEALKEKNLWLKLAPHITREAPFYLPVYKDSKWPLFFTKIGLFIYDLLSLFKNTPHKSFNKNDTLKKIPGLKEKDLKGSGMYFDGIVDDSKLSLDCIYDALENQSCEALNYKKVIKIENQDSDIKTILYQDTITNEFSEVRTKHIIFATGPFTDQVMKELKINWQPRLLLSKGSHLWLKKTSLPIKDPMVLQTKDKRIIFVIPQRQAILIGTTEVPLGPEHDILNIEPSDEEVKYLLDIVNEYFPDSKVGSKDILSTFAAVRPLVQEKNTSSKTSRKHLYISPQKDMHVIIGGKYTTFRIMAQDAVKPILKDLEIKFNKNLSKNPLRRTSRIKDPHSEMINGSIIEEIINTEKVRTYNDLITRRLSLPTLNHLEECELKDSLKQILASNNIQ